MVVSLGIHVSKACRGYCKRVLLFSTPSHACLLRSESDRVQWGFSSGKWPEGGTKQIFLLFGSLIFALVFASGFWSLLSRDSLLKKKVTGGTFFSLFLL